MLPQQKSNLLGSVRCFNGHPPLGVNATIKVGNKIKVGNISSFNGHPPLGVNATRKAEERAAKLEAKFQWAPTLGGECYVSKSTAMGFSASNCFNGHPPLGVNATV